MRVLRVVIVVAIVLGVNYIAWRWMFSLNWHAWWIAVPLVVAETYSLIDVSLFGLTMWRSRERAAVAPPVDDLTVDVFITTFNEPVELVLATARAAREIRYPHSTWILDDGSRPELEIAAREIGVEYLQRGAAWDGLPLHSKAGNLNNALMATRGEFVLVLDADQVPSVGILDRTLGYFADERVALVQTPQYFSNVPADDPLGSQAELFYGPIQQGKDGWNAAFFCGSNAVLRRDALMQLGVSQYVVEVERNVKTALRGARRVLKHAARSVSDNEVMAGALEEVSAAIEFARGGISAGQPLSSVTYTLQQRVDEISRGIVAIDVHLLARDLAAIGQLHAESDAGWASAGDLEISVDALAARDLSPLGALETVRTLLRSIDVDRAGEAQPLMPLATISVTEDMATSMRLHALGWKSVYHHEILAVGLAPEDLGTALKQRLRWGQGTLQVMLRENPLVQRGLTLVQRLLYFSTMWSYLSGFAAIVYFAAPIVFLCLGILPVSTTAFEFFLRFLPFMVVNQLLFFVAARGVPSWRGQQYSLALFPVWIRAMVTAFANVVFHRPLGFVVTPKVRPDGGANWRLVAPQAVVAVLLVIAAIAGGIRLGFGYGEPIGTIVNLAWVGFDLIILSVLVRAVRYKGFTPEEASR